MPPVSTEAEGAASTAVAPREKEQRAASDAVGSPSSASPGEPCADPRRPSNQHPLQAPSARASGGAPVLGPYWQPTLPAADTSRHARERSAITTGLLVACDPLLLQRTLTRRSRSRSRFCRHCRQLARGNFQVGDPPRGQCSRTPLLAWRENECLGRKRPQRAATTQLTKHY